MCKLGQGDGSPLAFVVIMVYTSTLKISLKVIFDIV